MRNVAIVTGAGRGIGRAIADAQGSERQIRSTRIADELGEPVCLVNNASAADLKSLTHSRQNRVQGLQIESGTRIVDLLVPMTFRSPRKGVAAMVRGLRKVGTRASARPALR
jgi:hypothetical protein